MTRSERNERNSEIVVLAPTNERHYRRVDSSAT